MKYYLIGYMGSGKSTVGQLLSDRVGLDYIDTDRWISQQTGQSIATLFENEGEKRFREIEKDALCELSQTYQNCIISTGGGLPCYANNMSYMLQNGTTIYLKSSIRDLAVRLSQSTHRPLITQSKSLDHLQQFISNHMKPRRAFYNQAEIKVWNRGPIHMVVNRLIKQINTQ